MGAKNATQMVLHPRLTPAQRIGVFTDCGRGARRGLNMVFNADDEAEHLDTVAADRRWPHAAALEDRREVLLEACAQLRSHHHDELVARGSLAAFDEFTEEHVMDSQGCQAYFCEFAKAVGLFRDKKQKYARGARRKEREGAAKRADATRAVVRGGQKKRGGGAGTGEGRARSAKKSMSKP